MDTVNPGGEMCSVRILSTRWEQGWGDHSATYRQMMKMPWSELCSKDCCSTTWPSDAQAAENMCSFTAMGGPLRAHTPYGPDPAQSKQVPEPLSDLLGTYSIDHRVQGRGHHHIQVSQ